MSGRLRIFLSSPDDVRSARQIAALTIERLAQDYARFFTIEPYLWESEAMLASGHFQDSIEPPSAFDIVVLILWSRLGTPLPKRSAVREYRGLDGRVPVTGTEWEFEEALGAVKQKGAPEILVYRSMQPAAVDLQDAQHREQQLEQLRALEGFWERHFANRGLFLGAFTKFATDGELADALEHHLRQLIEKRIASLPLTNGDRSNKVWMQAPFRGLESYEFEHAPIFFGQDEAVSKAMVQLTANAEAGSPFLLVLGSSGSGKSSLVKAGIVPKLFVPRRIPGAAFLRRVIFRPSDARENEDLFDAFARVLTTRTSDDEGLSELIGPGQSASDLAAHLRNAAAEPAYPIGTALGQLASAARRDGRMLEYETAKLVLVVDQLEELFTAERISPEERRKFVDLLGGLSRSGFVWIVATIRKDFWQRADETPDLVRMSEGNGRLELLPPAQSQLSQMIRRPAAAAGISFEHHKTTNVPLNEVIAEEVAHEPGALPLLSYLLDQLYRSDVLEAGGAALTLATYETLGRLEGAIATRAESVLENCAPEDRQALALVLFSLVQMSTTDGDIARAVSRRVPLSTFPPGTPQRRLVEALLDPDARLLVSDAEQGGHPTVRVAHEALITKWARARDFVQGNAEALKIRRRIEERYALWRGRGQASEDGASKSAPMPLRARLAAWRARFGHEPGLISEIDLVDGQRLLREHRPDTEPYLVEYIERSSVDDKRMRSRAVRVLATVAGVVTVLAVLASGAGLIALQKQREAELQTQQTLAAQSRMLTEAASERLNDGNIPGAQKIILEVLSDHRSTKSRAPTAESVFQELRAADPQLAILFGHRAAVNSAAWSPDGTHIVTASDDGTARIWDANTAAPLAVLSVPGSRVSNVAYSPDGQRIVAVSTDNTVRAWDSRTGADISLFVGHRAHVNSAAYSPDSRRIVTASDDKTARVWDAGTGAQLLALAGHSGEVNSAAWSPDGTKIVTASSDKTVRIWDAGSGTQLAVLADKTDVKYYSAAYVPDGKRIITVSGDNTARTWDAATGALRSVFSAHEFIIACSPDGTRTATESTSSEGLRIWEAGSATPVAVLYGHSKAVYSASWSPDGARIVTTSFDKTARIWSLATGSQLIVLKGHNEPVFFAHWLSDGRRIVTASVDKDLRVWDSATGVTLRNPSRLDGYAAAWSHDGKRFITVSPTKFSVRDWRTGSELITLPHKDNGNGLYGNAAWSPNDQLIVTAAEDKSARIWNAATGIRLITLSGHGDTVWTAAFSPDGRHVVTASDDKTARIWNAATGAQIAVLHGHTGPVYSADWSPDGTKIVTSSEDKTARVWDATTGTQIVVISGHRGTVFDATWSPEGKRIVTASDDKTARIWDARTGAELAVLAGHSGALESAEYSPDGQRILTASLDNTARIWSSNISPDLGASITWERAAEFDQMSEVDRDELGLPHDVQVRTWPKSSQCDQVAAAPYDPDRLAAGMIEEEIAGDVANTACLQKTAKSGDRARINYQLGRALLAKHDVREARRNFETAVSDGYQAAQIDLANLLVDPSAGMLDPNRSVALYENAWRDGVPIAAFELGQLYEDGVHGTDASAHVIFYPNFSLAWAWFRKGADAGEPNALARFGEKDDGAAVAAGDAKKRDAILLDGFLYYAAAAQRAYDEDWPDDAWKNWRYRRATIARLLARDGMMQQVADAYTEVRNKWKPRQPTWIEKVRAWLGFSETSEGGS